MYSEQDLKYLREWYRFDSEDEVELWMLGNGYVLSDDPHYPYVNYDDGVKAYILEAGIDDKEQWGYAMVDIDYIMNS